MLQKKDQLRQRNQQYQLALHHLPPTQQVRRAHQSSVKIKIKYAPSESQQLEA